MFAIQCTATSKARSGHVPIPLLHVPATKAQYYEDEADVEKHKLNRPFFKTLGKLSKYTLWWALFESGNTPDPLPTADSIRRASSVGFGGGQATLVNIDAQEQAERESKVGIKRVVYKSLESAIVQDRLRTASEWADFPGPEALAVAMDLGTFRGGPGTEVIKLINLPLPKGMASDLTPAGAKAYHVVDQLHNARCQRLSENLANRNIDATDIARIVKSITTFQLSRNQELVLVDEAHLFLGANSRGTGYTREAGSWGDFLDMISNTMEVMYVAFPTGTGSQLQASTTHQW